MYVSQSSSLYLFNRMIGFHQSASPQHVVRSQRQSKRERVRTRSQTAPCAICPRSRLALVQVQASEWKVMVPPSTKRRMLYMFLHLAASHMIPAGDLRESARR
jgi:hypothetical protein